MDWRETSWKDDLAGRTQSAVSPLLWQPSPDPVSLQEGSGSWWSLDAEVIMEDGRIICTKNKTGHALLVECRFEFPGGKY